MAKLSMKSASPPLLTLADNIQPDQSATSSKSAIVSSPGHPANLGSTFQPTSLTSKEWLVPPRPKPGRKPATDAPPTKRKAQNRAAQRAFRERRAARVGELEEEIQRIEIEDEEEQSLLREQIETLRKDVDEYKASLNVWMQTCRELRAQLAAEIMAKEEALQGLKHASAGSTSISASKDNQSHGERLHDERQEGAEAIGCGNCSSISDCQCIQDVINMPNVDSNSDLSYLSSNKRPHSSGSNLSPSKRIKPEPPDEFEIDFTTSFANLPSNTTRPDHTSTPSPSAVPDPCGFCTDGTACICAEMQAEDDNRTHRNEDQLGHARNLDPQTFNLAAQRPGNGSSLLSRISQLSHITPPPSESDVSLLHPATQQNLSLPSNPCINGPGTCLQCRSDPNSTLFCVSLARSRERQGPSTSRPNSGCCSDTDGTGNNSCCQLKSQPLLQGNPQPGVTTRSSNKGNPIPLEQSDHTDQRPPPPQEKSHPPAITLTCADAYTTLSRHPSYTKATNEIATWLPKLHPHPNLPTTYHPTLNPSYHSPNGNTPPIHTTPKPDPSLNLNPQSRPAMEIDVANIMTVLRDFDRRFTTS